METNKLGTEKQRNEREEFWWRIWGSAQCFKQRGLEQYKKYLVTLMETHKGR